MNFCVNFPSYRYRIRSSIETPASQCKYGIRMYVLEENSTVVIFCPMYEYVCLCWSNITWLTILKSCLKHEKWMQRKSYLLILIETVERRYAFVAEVYIRSIFCLRITESRVVRVRIPILSIHFPLRIALGLHQHRMHDRLWKLRPDVKSSGVCIMQRHK